jgi:CheY-like chemotaxis protein
VAEATAPSLAAIRGGSETILLVEDDAALRASMLTALTRLGYRMLQASTGAGALEVWRQNRDAVRLLITDMVMPQGMSGKELAQRLLQENPALKIICVSGYSTEVAGKDLCLKEDVNFSPSRLKPAGSRRLCATVWTELRPQFKADKPVRRKLDAAHFNKASACLRAASVWPPSIRASSVTRDFLSSKVISEIVRPFFTCLVTT